MIRALLVAVVALFVAINAFAGMSSDAAYVPAAANAQRDALRNALPLDRIRSYIEHASDPIVFTHFAGKNDELQDAALRSKSDVFPIGEGYSLSTSSSELIRATIVEGAYHVYIGAVRSDGAYGVRVCANLSGLGGEGELWVIDPSVPRAYGPYSAQDQVDGGRWLPSIIGDTAVLVTRTPMSEAPSLTLTGLSHFFTDVDSAAKVLSCNINIACETDAQMQELSSGVGVLVIQDGFSTGLCTGTLINNPQTEVFEPLLITANHCVDNSTTALNSELRWDYRASACDTDDPPSFGSLLRSDVVALLATNPNLDTTLLQLGEVPVGAFGRSYLGWNRRTPVTDEVIRDMHHPEGSHMRVNRGRVVAVGVSAIGYHSETKVVWDEGVTEGGSSGSALLFEDTRQILGMLSGGPNHTCGPDRSGNVDFFSSFRNFYSEIDEFIDDPNPPLVNGPSTCPLSVALKNQSELLRQLRTLRDKGLLKSLIGKQMVALYYQAAPDLARVVRRSSDSRDALVVSAAPLAKLGSWME